VLHLICGGILTNHEYLSEPTVPNFSQAFTFTEQSEMGQTSVDEKY